jgi:hypothetical protein
MMTNYLIYGSTLEPFTGQMVPEGASALMNVHDESKCFGSTCLIHNPSDHALKDWPYHWRGDIGVMERICPHGIGHPDPDSLGPKTHGCDGCCHVKADT